MVENSIINWQIISLNENSTSSFISNSSGPDFPPPALPEKAKLHYYRCMPNLEMISLDHKASALHVRN